MNALALGVLGCSSIARRRTLPAIGSVGSVRLAAVASRSRKTAETVAKEFSTTPTGYQELIDDPDVDAVYLSLPTGLHHEWTRRALLAGKHVLCEKPLTDNSARTSELTGLAAELGLVLRENFTFLHHPQHAKVRELVDEGRLGELRTVTATFGIPPLPAADIRYDRNLGGGSLLDVGVYPIRLALLLLGEQISVVGAVLRVDEALGVDVSGHALLTSADGVFADLEFGFQHSYRSRYRLWGSTASLSVDRAFTPPAEHRPVLGIEEQDHSEEHILPAAHQFRLSIASFAEAVLGGCDAATEEVWLAGARHTARLVDEVRAAATVVSVKGGVGN
jgi:predicted dehydrogenase